MESCRACGDSHPGSPPVCPRTGQDARVGPCGTRLDRYEIERWIAGGGMGSVYRARHAMLGQPVAIKLLHPRLAGDPEVVGRFLREARAASVAVSPHIVRVLDFGVAAEGTPFLVMELLAGESLETRLRREGRLPVHEVLRVAGQLLAGLAAAHAAGVVHRDVKPANVFLVPGPGGGRGDETVRLLDFGISKLRAPGFSSDPTATGAVMGTPAYMPPEQFLGAGEVDARADVYAAAAVIYETLAGARLFSDTEANARFGGGPDRPRRSLRDAAPDAPPALVAAVERALADDIAARFPNAGAFSAALADAAGFAPETVPTAPRAGGDGSPHCFAPPPSPSHGIAYDPTAYAPAPSFRPPPGAMSATMTLPQTSVTRTAVTPARPRRTTALLVVAAAGVLLVTGGLITVVALLAADPGSPGAAVAPGAQDSSGVHATRLVFSGMGSTEPSGPEAAVAGVLPNLAPCRLPGAAAVASVQFNVVHGVVTSSPIPLSDNRAPASVLECLDQRLRQTTYGALSGTVELTVVLDPG